MSAATRKRDSRVRVYLDPWVIEDFRKLIAEAQDPASGDGKHARVISERGYAYMWIGGASSHLEMLLKQVKP
jgi:hypothetical protein